MVPPPEPPFIDPRNGALMARPLRIEWEGCWYHITSRGNERRPIYLDDADRSEFLNRVREMTSRFQVRLYVYALMVNHYHLLLQTLEANLSAAMRWLNSGYSQWFNARHRRCGHLLQGRFKGIVVEPQAWGLELSRYIHLNPVRVERFQLGKRSRARNQRGTGGEGTDLQWQERLEYLRNYPWSSYRAYVGRVPQPSWLECEQVLGWMGADTPDPARAYQQYVEAALREGLKQQPWQQLTAQVVLGSAAFVTQLQGRVHGNVQEQGNVRHWIPRPAVEQVIRVVETVREESWNQMLDHYGDWGRDLVLYLANENCGLSLHDLGRAAAGMRYKAVCEAIRRFKALMRADPTIAPFVDRASRLLKTLAEN